VLDRNTRISILASRSQLTDDVQRLLVQAAYQQASLVEVRNDPKELVTLRGLIDAGVPFVLSLLINSPTRRFMTSALESMRMLVR